MERVLKLLVFKENQNKMKGCKVQAQEPMMLNQMLSNLKILIHTNLEVRPGLTLLHQKAILSNQDQETIITKILIHLERMQLKSVLKENPKILNQKKFRDQVSMIKVQVTDMLKTNPIASL